MNSTTSRRIKLAQIFFGVVIMMALVVAGKTQAAKKPVHLATDWSHRHVIFSNPKSLAKQVRFLSNPRFVQQGLRRGSGQTGGFDVLRWRRAQTQPLKGDWAMYMGYNGNPAAIVPGTAGPGNYPAKFSFDPTSANCSGVPGVQPDFVVFNTSLMGSSSAIPGITTGTVISVPHAGDTIVINNTNGSGAILTLTAGSSNSNTGTGTGTFDVTGGTTTSVATAVAAAINIPANNSYVGVSAVSAGNALTLYANTAGDSGGNIFVYGSTTPSEISFTFSQFQDGASGIPSIMAFDNLYDGTCASNSLNDYWAYNTGGQVVTSPSISGDGAQVVFVQTAGGVANLVILKWANDGSSVIYPATLTSQASAAAYRTCTAPCMYSIPFSGATNNTHSSPFYDYSNDVVYVGDNSGYLHKFTGIFYGNPAEVVSSGASVWPATVNVGAQLISPVYDDGDGGRNPNTPGVFVADNQGVLHRVDAANGSGTSGAAVFTKKLADFGFEDAPLLDPSTGEVYVFARYDLNGGGERPAVFQFSTEFIYNDGGAETVVASDSTFIPTAFYDGTFDNIYYSGTGNSGNMYVCSTNGGVTALWRIPLTNTGALGTAVAGPSLATASVNCSPVTEFNNGSTDRIFVSVSASSVTGFPVNCTGGAGCIISYDVTTATGWGTSSISSNTAPEAGGTSAIIVDGSSATPGASQVYFSPLATGSCYNFWQGIGGCAIQASQSGLN